MRVNDFGKSLFYDKYYHGMTTFRPQRQVCLAHDAKGELALPAKWEAARARCGEVGHARGDGQGVAGAR